MCPGIMIRSGKQCRRSTTSQPIRTIRLSLLRSCRCGKAKGINSVAYEGGKIAEQQRQAYPDVVPLTVGLAPAFARALDTAQRMGWTIVASDKATGQIEASQRSRWMGFTDDIV